MGRFVTIIACSSLVVMFVLLGVRARDDFVHRSLQTKTMESRERLEDEIRLRAASQTTELNTRGWPVEIDPAWFDEEGVPRNAMLTDLHPWLEIVGPDEADRQHPTTCVAIHDSLASFWYNPYQGIIRARVPMYVSDARTLAMYNRVNESDIATLLNP